MNATDDLQSTFSEVWTLLAGTTSGFANTGHNFRSLGLFYELQSSLTGNTNWTTIQTAEDQLAARTNYANTLSNGAACPTTILAEDVPNANVNNGAGRQPEDGSFVNSNQFKSNDFYQYSHPGGALTIALSYTTTANDAANLALYLWNGGYTYGDSDDLVGFSNSSIATTATSGSETISVPILNAGTYMINVRYDTTNGIDNSANYSLTINGQGKCPD